jgi:CBS domain-containing protein
MSVGEICNRNVIIAYKSVVLSEAARLMRDQHVGSLVIVEQRDQGRVPIGILTDRDIIIAVVARDLDARNMAISEAMSADLVIVHEEDAVVDALRLMRSHGVRRVPVVAREGALVGIITVDDLLEIVARELSDLAGAIQSERAHEIATRV